MGVGQLKEDLQANFSLLRSTINSLKNTNERLTTEIELKAAYEQELILSSRKFKSLFDSSRDGVLLLNSRGQVIEANQIILDMTGYDLEELRHIDIYDFVDDRFREQMKKNFDLVVYGNIQPPLTEFTIYNNKGETIPVELNTNLIITENDVMVLSTIRDISFRKELENEKFNAVIEAEERERERFSKDLHDDLGPVFSAAKLYLQTLQQQETDSKKLQVLEKITTVIDTAVKSVREISHNLSPYLLRDVGLVEAIKTHLRKIEENSELKVSAEVKTEVDRLPVNIEVVIYRVFLELLNNTFKHSSASSIQIFLYYSKSNVKFIYIDNGIGFDLVEKLKKNEGIGLRNMMNRIKAFNGTIKFNSIEGEMVTKIDIAL
ncbi:MAG: PAS domain S-box protein [Cyclobacteriaceae bacterium]